MRDNKATSITFKGKIFDQLIFILINFRANKSFISSYLLHKIPSKPIKMYHPWNVEFALG